jgi:hypothetical protein
MLQAEHSAWRLSKAMAPPLDQGVMWSTCKVTAGSLAGLAPYMRQMQLSLSRTVARRRRLIRRDRTFFLARRGFLPGRGLGGLPRLMYASKACRALFQVPKRAWYAVVE